MSLTGSQAFADDLLRRLTESPPSGWTLVTHQPALPPLTLEPELPAILAAKEGDLIEVIQPDGEHETYRLTSPEPTADGFGVTFQLERQP